MFSSRTGSFSRRTERRNRGWRVRAPTTRLSNSVTIEMGQESGTKFPPNFVSSDVTKIDWGSLTFTQTDCTHATVSWVSKLRRLRQQHATAAAHQDHRRQRPDMYRLMRANVVVAAIGSIPFGIDRRSGGTWFARAEFRCVDVRQQTGPPCRLSRQSSIRRLLGVVVQPVQAVAAAVRQIVGRISRVGFRCRRHQCG